MHYCICQKNIKNFQISSEPIFIPQVSSSPTLVSSSSPKFILDSGSSASSVPKFGLYDSEQNSSCGSLPGSGIERCNSSSSSAEDSGKPFH